MPPLPRYALRARLPRPALALLAMTAAVFSTPSHAQSAASYPAKPIRLIVPFSPGGPADMLARPLGQGFTESWGQQVIIDHRAGAGGILAAEILAKAPADGYTIMITTPGIAAVNPGLHTKLP